MKAIWLEAGLGPFPEEHATSDERPTAPRLAALGVMVVAANRFLKMLRVRLL